MSAPLIKRVVGALLVFVLAALWRLPSMAQDAAQLPPLADARSAARSSERLALIKRRGALVVGVKTDYAPFGGVDVRGRPEGFEHDLAKDLARRIGVTLYKVSVTSANRLQKLEEGAIDIAIATLGDTAERRKIATLIEPSYYASGVTLFVPPSSTVKDWPDVRGQKVCATQGAYFNREMAKRYLLDLQLYGNARDAKLAVRDMRCVGYLFDNTAIAADLLNPEWAGYKAPLVPSMNAPWAIAIARKEQGTDFEQLISLAVADWHRSGFLIEREKAWGLPPSKFLADSRRLWAKVASDGRPLCRWAADGQLSVDCRNAQFVSSSEFSGLRQFGLKVKEATGIDLSILFDPDDSSAFFRGLGLTVLLTLACILGSVALGIFGAVVGDSRSGLVRRIAAVTNVFGRMTPPLLQIYLVLFGIGSVLAAEGIRLPPALVVIACLSFYAGAGVMVALQEAAKLYRQSSPRYRLTWRSLSPLIRYSSGSVVAALVNISKATMMASAVAVPELLSAATAIMSERGNVGVVMNAVLLTFLALILVVVRLLAWIELKLVSKASR